MADFKRGTGRLATDRYDFQDHITGANFRHKASAIDLDTPLIIDGITNTTVGQAFTSIQSLSSAFFSSGTGFISLGDGYDTFHLSDTNPTAPYDSSIPSINAAINDILTNPLNPAFHRLRDGGIIFLKAGTYKVDNTITLPAGISIMGEGFGTKIVNVSTNKPMFYINQDILRQPDKTIDSTNPFLYARENIFYNLLISDNFIEPKFLGDTAYLTPNNTNGSTPLIGVQAGAHFTCDNVKFAGKTTYITSVLHSLTSIPISIDPTTPVNTGTIVNVRNCFIDGFSQACSFVPNNSSANFGKNDYFSFINNKVRIFGYLNSDSASNVNNTFIKFNSCNASIYNNYLYGSDTGFVKNYFYLNLTSTASSDPTDNSFPVISIQNNIGNVNKLTDVSVPVLINSSSPISDTYLKISNNKLNFTNNSQDSNLLYLSVGDGTTSFGDFNGVNSISDAVGFFGTNLHIIIKSGTYTLNDLIVSDINLILEGTSKSDCIINGFSNNTIFETQTPSSSIICKNLTIVGNTANKILNTTGLIILENVDFTNCKLQNVNGNNSQFQCIIKNCNFTGSSTNPVVRIEANDGYTHSGYLFENTTFISAGESPIVSIAAGTSANNSTVIGGIKFTNCTFYPGHTTDGTGKFANNCGIIALDYGANSGTGFDGVPIITVRDILLKNCNGYSSTSSNFASLFHLIPTNNGINYTLGTGTYISLKSFEIDGGEYLIDPRSYSYSPFNIALDILDPISTRISLRNITIGFNSQAASQNGSQTSDLVLWFGTNTAANWAFSNLSADVVEIQNVIFKNFTKLSNSGELFVSARDMNIDNVNISKYYSGGDGSGTAPNRRVYLTGGGAVKNLNLTGYTSTANNDWTATTPVGNVGILVLQNSVNLLELNNINISNYVYNTSSNTACGIGISNKNKTGVHNIDFLHINNSFISNCVAGIAYQTGTNANTINFISINNNYINATGISIYFTFVANSSTNAFGKINILNNRLISTTTGPNIYIDCASWGITTLVKILNNSLNSATEPHIELNDTVSGTQANLNGIILGNTCDTSSGQFKLLATGNIGNGNYTIAQMPIRGVETGHNSATTRAFTDGNGILYNVGVLKLS